MIPADLNGRGVDPRPKDLIATAPRLDRRRNNPLVLGATTDDGALHRRGHLNLRLVIRLAFSTLAQRF